MKVSRDDDDDDDDESRVCFVFALGTPREPPA
jgi:hypothetical protein